MEQQIIDYYKELYAENSIMEIVEIFKKQISELDQYQDRDAYNELVEIMCSLVALSQRLHINRHGCEAVP